MVEKVTGARKFFRSHGDEIAIYFSQIIFVGSVFAWAYAALAMLNSTTANYESIKSFAGFCIRSLPAFALLVVMLLSVKTYVENTPFFSRGSGILFTDHDRDQYAKLTTQNRRAVLRFVAVQVVALAVGLLSNIIYNKNWFWGA